MFYFHNILSIIWSCVCQKLRRVLLLEETLTVSAVLVTLNLWNFLWRIFILGTKGKCLMTAKCLWTYSHSTQEKRNGGGVDLGERKGGGGADWEESRDKETVVEMHCIREEFLKILIWKTQKDHESVSGVRRPTGWRTTSLIYSVL